MAKFVLRGGFPAGTKVEIRERVGDNYSRALKKVKTATVSKRSELEVEGLKPGSYFVAAEVDGELRVRAVTAKGADEASRVEALQPARTRADGSVIPNPLTKPELSPSLRSQREDPEIVTGMKTTRSRGHVPPPDPLALEHQEDSQNRQDGVKALGEAGAPKELASDTFAGQAFAANPGRLQQADVPEGTPQASSTELGDASIIVEVSEPQLGDHDPFRASGDPAVGPAGTVTPNMQGQKSTSRLRLEAEKEQAARAKPAKGKKAKADAQRAAKNKRARGRRKAKAAEAAAAGRQAETPQSNTPGKPEAPVQPEPNRGERSTSRAAGKSKKAVQKDAQKQATAKSRGRS